MNAGGRRLQDIGYAQDPALGFMLKSERTTREGGDVETKGEGPVAIRKPLRSQSLDAGLMMSAILAPGA